MDSRKIVMKQTAATQITQLPQPRLFFSQDASQRKPTGGNTTLKPSCVSHTSNVIFFKVFPPQFLLRLL